MSPRVLSILAALVLGTVSAHAQDRLLNVSYDPTREFYVAYDALFAAWWKTQTGEDVKVEQSHGGSGKQART